MWIKSVTAHAFGPFQGETLDLAEGMTVVYGPNEAGKSSWHAAVYAALCGTRARRGGPSNEERAFRSKRQPWGGEEWRVSCVIRLPDGRTVELDHDLAGQVGTTATDLGLGSDVSGEIENQGTPDGSRWLGLERQSFLAVASIRQAEVMSITEHAGALQDYLQRAAATSGAAATAAAAIEAIDSFKSEHVGLRRANSTRPLQRAIGRLRLAEQRLEEAIAVHDQWLDLVAAVAEKQEAASTARNEARRAEAVHARWLALEAQRRHQDASDLSARFQGEPPPGGAGADLAEEVASAIHEWRGLPEAPTLGGPDAVELEARLDAMPPTPTDDLEPHEAVTTAHRRLVLALDRHTAHTQPELGHIETESPDRPEPRGRRGGVVALGSTAVASVAVGAWLLSTGANVAGALVLGLGVVLGASTVVAGQRSSLRALVAEEMAAAPSGRDRWQERERVLAGEVEEAAALLARSLADRGIAAAEGAAPDSLESIFSAYEAACRERRSQAVAAAARPGVEQALAERRRAEVAFAAHQRKVLGARQALERALAGIGESAPMSEDAMVEALVDWQAGHRARLREVEEARAGWARLQAILDGESLESLAERATRMTERATELGVGLGEDLEFDLGPDPDATVRRLREKAEDLDLEVASAQSALKVREENILSVAEAEEERAEARSELDRVERLEVVLDITRGYLEGAQDRVHRTIAPLLAEKVQSRLALVTDGRYREATVHPETLQVQVRDAEGRLRDASILSHGTAEQVYLLLRVAMAEVLTPAGASCPLLLDDTTVHSDSDRTVAVLDVLHEVSGEHQVVLFTQEQDVLTWARAALGERDRLEMLGAGGEAAV